MNMLYARKTKWWAGLRPSMLICLGIGCIILLTVHTTLAEKGSSSTAPIEGPDYIFADLATLERVPMSEMDDDIIESRMPEKEPEELRQRDEFGDRSPTWYTIDATGFEGGNFTSTTDWDCYCSGVVDAYWDDEPVSDGARVYGGTWSGYCANAGTSGVEPPGPYPANMSGWMVYGPFTLHDATDAELNFWHWTYTESAHDQFGVYASVDGSNWYGTSWSGNQGGWKSYSLDLANVYTLGNLCGQRQVWVAFYFGSDASIQYEGTYIDDIVLQKEVKNWTVAVYLAADNTLGGTPALADIDEMEKALVTSGGNVNVIVLYDDIANPDTRLFWVQPDSTEGVFNTYYQDITYWNIPAGWAFTYPASCPDGYPIGSASLIEHDMGAQSTLTSFLDWVFRNFKSDHYALILWDHGGGWEPKEVVSPTHVEMLLESGAVWEQTFWPRAEEPLKKVEPESPIRQPLADSDRGICWDDTSGTYLDTKEMAYGIENSTRGWVNILGFDACLMQMLEVAYEIWATLYIGADYITASEESEWGQGWAYHQILSGITSTTTSLQLATTFGTTRSERFASGGLDTISSLDVWEVDNLATAVSALADRLTTLLATNSYYQDILYAKLLSLTFASNEYVDLDDFCWWIDFFIGDTTARNLAQAVRAQIADTVVAMANSSGYSSAGGISIYMPHYQDISLGAPHSNYNATNLAFCNDHTWDNFLNSWLAADYPDPYESNDTPATAYNLSNSYSQNILYLYAEADFDDSSADWYKFTVPFACNITVYAWCTEYYSDTVIYLYDSLASANANSHFAWDNYGIYYILGRDNLGSYLNYTTRLNPGTYYLKVIPSGAYGLDRDYELWVSASRAPTPAVFRVESDGHVLADGTLYSPAIASGAADVAEWVLVSEPVEAGDVLELDPENPQHYRKSTGSCSSLVAGVVSTQPGVTLGLSVAAYSSPLTDHAQALLALVGIVPVKVCNEGGPIEVGDLLVTASIPGYARKWDAENGEPCPLIGKALEKMTEETGTILVLLMR